MAKGRLLDQLLSDGLPARNPARDTTRECDRFRKERPESRYGENWERRGLSQMRIDHLSLMNWRNFKTVDVSLGNRLFVVGPNASGKSNLLDALRFLRDVAN